MVVQPSWQEIHPISEELFLVGNGGGYTIINRSEKRLLPGGDYEAIRLMADNNFSFFLLKQNGKWGVKQKGQEAWSIEPIYAELEFLQVGPQGLFKAKKVEAPGNKWQVINWEEANLPGIENGYQQVLTAGRNHFATQEIIGKTKWSIRDLTGKEVLVLDPQTIIKPLNKHLFGYKERGRNTFSVLVMRTKISPLAEQFQDLHAVNDTLAFYTMGNQAGLITSNGSLVDLGAEGIAQVSADEGDLLRVKCIDGENTAAGWGLYAWEEQNFVLPCQYDSIGSFEGRFALVFKAEKVGLVNKSGKIDIPARYEEIPAPSGDAEKIYAYRRDSVRVYPVDENGNPAGEPSADRRHAILGPGGHHWPEYRHFSDEESVATMPPIGGTMGHKVQKKYWQELIQEDPQDTIWMEEGKSFWQFTADNYQLLRQEQVEVIVRENSTNAKKKKKKRRKRKKRKKAKENVPKKTELVTKWVAKGGPYKFLRKASSVNWTLAYHGNDGLVTNELTTKGRTRYSMRKISVFLGDNNAVVPDFEMTGIRLSDFERGLPYAAFMDLDGKMGLIDRQGKQASTVDGSPLRFTYIGAAAEGKAPVCHAATAFSEVGLGIAELFEAFNVELVNATGGYISDLESTKKPLWAYIDLQGKVVIPFEYDLATPFEENFALNKKNGKWGAINGDNKVLIPFDYDAIYSEGDHWKVIKGTDAVERLFFDQDGRRYSSDEHAKLAVKGHHLYRVQNRESPPKYGYLDQAGKLAIPCKFDEASNFLDGLATVRKDKQWSFIDSTGKEVITIDSSLIGIIEVGSFSEDLCPLRKMTIIDKKAARKYGYLDRQGQLAIPAKFDRAGIFRGGLAIVDSLNFAGYKPGQPGGIPTLSGLIDKEGKMVAGYEYKHIFPFNQEGFAEVIHAKMNKRGVIGKDGKVVTGNFYDRVKCFKDGMAGANDTKWKFFDYTGNEITLPIAGVADISHFEDGNLLIRDQSNGWHHLVVSGNTAEVKQGDFQLLQPFDKGYTFARKDKQSLLYGEDQSWVRPQRGRNFKFWSQNLIGIMTFDGEYYGNLGLQNAFSRTFDAVNPFRGDCAVVRYRGKSGVINRNGLFVVPPKYDQISLEDEGYIEVQSSSRRYGLYGKDGSQIVPPIYDRIQYLENGIIKVENADFVGYYRPNGEPLWTLEEGP